MLDKSVGLIGMMRKANAIRMGEQNTEISIKKGEAILILVAEDSSQNAVKRANGFSAAGSIPWVQIPITKEQLSDITGKTGCAMAAVTDAGFASALLRSFSSEEYEDLIATLEKLKKQKKTTNKTTRIKHTKQKMGG